MEKNLRMSLMAYWFEMTKAGIKKEDYREITPYWVSRLIQPHDKWITIDAIIYYLKGGIEHPLYGDDFSFKEFTQNTMTLGYPKSGDTERILKLEHAGIEIRTGNPEWGAEPGKLYFVIKHGEIINN